VVDFVVKICRCREISLLDYEFVGKLLWSASELSLELDRLQLSSVK
jgi:hypothetical protein